MLCAVYTGPAVQTALWLCDCVVTQHSTVAGGVTVAALKVEGVRLEGWRVAGVGVAVERMSF